MSARPTIALFDIDGTLVSCGGAGRRALTSAFAELFGRSDALGFDFGGLTDRAIVRAGLVACGAPEHEREIDRVIERYLMHLPRMVESSESYSVLPGAAELIDRLLGDRRFAVGLGTGNVRAGAATKLGRARLWERFAFGGFGCDHEQRSELIAIGARRGSHELGQPLEQCRVVVIGDTPRDVAAAHAIGAECLAVATGGHSAEELASAGADWVVAELSDPAALDVLTDASSPPERRS